MTEKSDKESDLPLADDQDKGKKKEKDNPPTPAELLEDLPDNMPAEMKRVVSMALTQASFNGGGNRAHPLFDKFTEDHVHKYLDYIQRDDDFGHKLKATNRWFHLAYTVILIIFFGFLIVYLLPLDKALLNEIFKLLITFIGGTGSGYGLKSYLETKR